MSSIQQLSFLPDAEVDAAAPPVVDNAASSHSVKVSPQQNTAPSEKPREAASRPAALTRAAKPTKPMPAEGERYLSVREVGARYSVSIQTVWRHTKYNPDFPQPIKILNGSTRWRMSDILAFEVSRQDTDA